MLKISHITKTFGVGTTDAKKALDELSLDVRRGDFITIIGANGAGKSTLLGAIAGSFITDSGVQPLYLERLRERGIEVTVVDV